MSTINFNGQNGAATSAVTSVMASAFAAEMDSIFAKATSTKKNFPVMNFLCNVKVGTKREMPLITENETFNGIKRNMLVTLLAPFGTSTMKGWVYQVNGKVQANSVVWLLEAAIKHIEKFEKAINNYKAGATNFTKKFIEVVEQYGVADIERRIAEIHQYFADLAGVEEQVEYNAPCLENEQVVEQEQSAETINSTNVNVEVFYITYNGVKKVVNAFDSLYEIREINRLISEAIAFGKKDFNLYYKIGDFVGCFSVVKDSKGNYVLRYGNEQVDLGFTKLVGKNIDTLIHEIRCAINKMVTKCEQKIAKKIASEKNEIIESMVENETSFDTHIFNSFGLFEYLFPNQNDRGVYYWVEHYVEEYYKECMKKKLVKKYNLNYDLDSHKLDLLFRDYMDMLDKKWDFENALLAFENVAENAPQNNAPCLDIDIAVDRVVNTIKDYVNNYDGLMLDYDGDSACICVGWDNFSEEDMQMLIEDDVFEGLVVGELVGEDIEDVLVYDDGVYVTVDYDKTFDKSNVLNTLRREYALCDVDEYEMPINTLADLCGGYHVNAPIYVMYDKESDSYYVNGLGEDNDFAINEELTSKTTYMELYDKITELLENVNVADTIENALDEAMESDDEYSDDVICQIGKWFVKYTSPCDKFPSGCVCVVDAKGVNMGGTWCSAADFDTAVEYLVGMIEKLNNEFNKVA